MPSCAAPGARCRRPRRCSRRSRSPRRERHAAVRGLAFRAAVLAGGSRTTGGEALAGPLPEDPVAGGRASGCMRSARSGHVAPAPGLRLRRARVAPAPRVGARGAGGTRRRRRASSRRRARSRSTRTGSARPRARPYALVVTPGSNAALIRRLAERYGARWSRSAGPRELLAYCRERSIGMERGRRRRAARDRRLARAPARQIPQGRAPPRRRSARGGPAHGGRARARVQADPPAPRCTAAPARFARTEKPPGDGLGYVMHMGSGRADRVSRARASAMLGRKAPAELRAGAHRGEPRRRDRSHRRHAQRRDRPQHAQPRRAVGPLRPRADGARDDPPVHPRAR